MAGPIHLRGVLRLALPPSETFACTDTDVSFGERSALLSFYSDPCLSLRVFRLDEPPSIIRLGLVQMHKHFYHSCRSLMTGAWELGSSGSVEQKFRRHCLHPTRCATENLDILLFENIVVVFFASAHRRRDALDRLFGLPFVLVPSPLAGDYRRRHGVSHGYLQSKWTS